MEEFVGLLQEGYEVVKAAAPVVNVVVKAGGAVYDFVAGEDDKKPADTKKTTSASCKGCGRAAGGTNQAQVEEKIFYGKPLYPGLKAKTTCQDELFDAAKNQWVIYRPTMVNLCTPNLPHDSDQSATAPLPTPQQAHLAPGWTPESFAQANKGIRATLAGVSLDAQPDENLKYFWAAVAKFAPQSAEYYVAQGVPVPADFKQTGGALGGANSMQVGGLKLTPVQILLIAALAWYLLKK